MGQSPANHNCVVGAINLGVPGSEAFVETGRNEAGKHTLEPRTTKERDMASVRKILEQGRKKSSGRGRSRPGGPITI